MPYIEYLNEIKNVSGDTVFELDFDDISYQGACCRLKMDFGFNDELISILGKEISNFPKVSRPKIFIKFGKTLRQVSF